MFFSVPLQHLIHIQDLDRFLHLFYQNDVVRKGFALDWYLHRHGSACIFPKAFSPFTTMIYSIRSFFKRKNDLAIAATNRADFTLWW
jgi:hypothetical protein